MKEKRCIVTRADDVIFDMTNITFPYLKKYADFCNADFLVINDSKNIHSHYRILQFYDLFDYYDRIISLDCDILIMKTCPNLFDVVDKKNIGSIFEDVGTRKFDRRERLQKIQNKFGNLEIKSGYINTGVSIFSKEHKDIFKYDDKTELYLDLGFDDVYLTYMIHKYNFKIQELDYIWNFMSMFEESWNDNKSRFNAFITHYAGGGFNRFIPRLEQIKEDEILLRKYGLLI